MYSPVGGSVSCVSWNGMTRTVTATVEVSFFDTLSGDLRLNLYMVAHSLYSSGTGWDQSNSANTFPGHPYYGWGDPIPGYKHRHVYMTGGGGAWGTPDVIPDTVYPGDHFSYTFTLEVPYYFWESNKQADSITPDLITLVGGAQRYHTAFTIREIFNATAFTLATVTAVSSFPDPGQMQIFPNPVSGKCEIRFPALAGICWCCLTDLTGKEIWLNAEQLSGDTYRLLLNTIHAGMYLLEVGTADGIYRKRLVVY